MQIIFRMTGLTFGKIWLSFVFISLLVFFYSTFRESVHPILAGLLLILLIAVPEFYAYTFMILTDFSNAVFFSISIVLFWKYVRERTFNSLLLSSLFMGFACWCRSETVVFAFMGAVLLFLLLMKSEGKKAIRYSAVFILVPLAFVLAWNGLFVNLYLGNPPEGQINAGLFDFAHLALVLRKINTLLLFNTQLYGYIMFFFIGLAFINLAGYRDSRGYEILLWSLLLYIGFVVIAHTFPAATVQNTIKRSFFKFFPLFTFYLSQTSLFDKLSNILRRVEGVA